MKRSFLTALGLEKEIIDQIMDEYGSSVELLKDKHSGVLAAETEKLRKRIGELQDVIDSAPAAHADGGDWKDEHDRVKGEYSAYMASVEAERAAAAKQAALRRQLSADGANPKLIDLLELKFDLSEIGLEDGGGIKDWDAVSKPVKERYPDIFGTTETRGADVGSPPSLTAAAKDAFHFDFTPLTPPPE